MKKIVTTAVVLIAVLVLAPWGIGKLAESRVNRGLDKLGETAPYLTIVDRRLTRGWFRSEQVVTFEVFGAWARAMNPAAVYEDIRKAEEKRLGHAGAGGDSPADDGAQPTDASAPDAASTPGAAPAAAESTAPAAPAKPLRFTVRNEILHGPVLWPFSLGLARVNTRFQMSDEVRKALVEVFGTDEPVRVSTRIGFFGGATTRLAGDGRTIKLKDGSGNIGYSDFKFDVSYSGTLDDVDADGTWARLEFHENGGSQIAMKDMKFESRSARLVGDLYDTDFLFQVGEMTVVGADKAETRVENLHYQADTDAKGDFLDVAVKLGSGEVSSKQLHDIGLQISEIHYDFTLHHLHTQTLAKMSAAMKQAYSQPVSNLTDFESHIFTPLKDYGLQLLNFDPELTIDRMGVVTPEGEGVLKGVVRLKGVTPADFRSGSMTFLGKIDSDMTIDLAQKLVDKIPNGNTGVGAAIDAGYAKRDGDKITSHIEFKRGELKINGKSQSLPGLGGAGAEAQSPPPAVPEG
ncbi:MAG TPA: DUF945 family protein [Steroidobacteraceae bacterium]|nr:DUF945 family protein [Steroidobacteraceae bacterium]